MSSLHEREHYEKSKGTTLTVHLGDNESAEIRQANFSDQSNDSIDGFSVVFEGPHDMPLDQDVHTVTHPEAGRGEMMLVPIVSKDPSVRKYEFVVSNLKGHPATPSSGNTANG